MEHLVTFALCATVGLTTAFPAPARVDVEQIHIAQGGTSGMGSVTISWMSNQSNSGLVRFGTTSGKLFHMSASTKPTQYTFVSAYIKDPYTSMWIHHAEISGLQPSTTYYYVCGSAEHGFSTERSFRTVGPELSASGEPFTFAVMGDLGQTSNSSKTVQHILDGGYSFSLLVGDLSYADSAWKPTTHGPCTPVRWDTWGRFIEPLASTMPLMVLPGNHEVEQDGPPPATQTEFLAFQKRFRMPAEESFAPEGNLYYSFNAAGVHFVMLNSYGEYNETSKQYAWLATDLHKVDRSVTPWIVVSMHAPWYNSNQHHHNEIQETGMRAAMEDLLNDHSVDLVLAGHVHAYERMYNVYNNKTNTSGPVYINIGDAGNREGPCPEYFAQPSWSAFREAKFGHGTLEVANATHMHWSWHRIIDEEHSIGDDVWLVKKGSNGHGATAVGVGLSATQYDGYATKK